MEFVDTITLPGRVGLVVLLGCVYIVFRGRQDWAAGIYVSSAYATRSIMIGPVVHTWVFLGTMIGAAVVHAFRTGRLYPLPPRQRWIVVWMAFWWVWMLVLLWQFDPEVKMSVLRYLVLYIVAPLPVVLQLSRDLRQTQGFAIAFVGTSLVGAFLALYAAAGSLGGSGGILGGLGVSRLGLVNYHVFSYGLGIGLLLTIALLMACRGVLARLALLAGTTLFVVFVFLAGSRQTMFGLAVALLLLVLPMGVARGARLRSRVLVAAVIVVVAVWLYGLAPEQITRAPAGAGGWVLSGAVEERSQLALAGWKNFLGSPLWGWGFTRYYSHNLFVGTLADQGLVGMGFLAGFLWFVVRQARHVLVGAVTDDAQEWRLTFLAILLFGLVHSQTSGSPDSVWHLYWSAAFIWGLGWRSVSWGQMPEARST